MIASGSSGSSGVATRRQQQRLVVIIPYSPTSLWQRHPRTSTALSHHLPHTPQSHMHHTRQQPPVCSCLCSTSVVPPSAPLTTACWLPSPTLPPLSIPTRKSITAHRHTDAPPPQAYPLLCPSPPHPCRRRPHRHWSPHQLPSLSLSLSLSPLSLPLSLYCPYCLPLSLVPSPVSRHVPVRRPNRGNDTRARRHPPACACVRARTPPKNWRSDRGQ